MMAFADLSLLGPPFLAGLLVLATHVPLGREVLARGIIFIDLAIAQIAALGVIAAVGAGLDDHGFAVQAVAGASALSGALLLHFTERYWPQDQEALIGGVFVLAATGSLIALAGNPRGGEHLADLLAGQVLWITADHLIPAAVITALLLAVWHLLPSTRLRFYGVFALAVTLSVQLVGVYLVFASLIMPALAIRGRSGKGALLVAYAIGGLAYVSGLVLSAQFDLPTGPTIVWLLAMGAVVTRTSWR